MRKKLMRNFCMVITLALIFYGSMLTVYATEVVESGSCGENATWTLDDQGTLTISGTGAMLDYEMTTVPWKGNNIKKVVIADGITKIGAYAFAYTGIEEIDLPESIETISPNAFQYASKLEYIKIPSKVKTIAGNTFYGSGLTKIDLANVETIGMQAFSYCQSLMEVTIPDTVVEIGNDGFAYCTQLKTVNLPSKIPTPTNQYSYFSAFNNCSSLERLALPEGVTNIGDLYGCTALKELIIPDGVINIKNIKDCPSLEIIDLPDSVEMIGDIVNCTSLSTIILNEGIWDVGTFDGCINLADIKLPSSLEYFGGIKNNPNLTEYVIPDGNIRYIGSFDGCTNLKTITLPKSVSNMGWYYFYDVNGNIEIDNNPNPKYPLSPNEVIPLTTEIRCYAGSLAESYAKEFGYKYEIIEEKKDTEETDNNTDNTTSDDKTNDEKTSNDETNNNETTDDTENDNSSSDNKAFAEKQGKQFASNAGNTFTKDSSGIVRCYDESTGEPVINDFKCDGTYTYYFQTDGTAMQDRLTYHPDGVHVIYFDSNGHEVFSNFANVKKTIAGEAVDDYCFFDVHGYLYVDVVTYDRSGKELYYANPYGVLERGKWFQFSESVKCADGTPWNGAAGNYGYANADGTLLVNQYTYDWEGRYCYMQGNGAALYQ